jgi:hypothetical protein
MQRINVNLFPKDGYLYKEADGTTLAGNTWEGVIARVRSYRKRAGLPPGNPDEEVRAQACQRNPAICTNDDGQHAAAVKVATLKSRILQWFAKTKRENSRLPIEFFKFEEEMKARADICASCPQNKEMPDGCSSCRAAVSELRSDIIGGRRVDGRLTHHGCNVLGSDLATSVWINEPTVDNPELPPHCWRKRTL